MAGRACPGQRITGALSKISFSPALRVGALTWEGRPGGYSLHSEVIGCHPAVIDVQNDLVVVYGCADDLEKRIFTPEVSSLYSQAQVYPLTTATRPNLLPSRCFLLLGAGMGELRGAAVTGGVCREIKALKC